MNHALSAHLLGGKMRRFIGFGVTAAIMFGWGETASSQSGASFDLPAEFPPASYTGRQYVDSRGCIYVRAGIDGQVTWIPRVTRDRKVICGQTPTLASTKALAASASAKTPEPEQITVQSPTPTSATKPKPAGKPAKRVVRQTRSAKVASGPTPHVNLRPGRPVTASTSPTAIVAPRHVYEEQIKSNGLYVPKGYEPVWTDDRLNPRRQHQTLAGKAQMDAIWTRTVPRTLKDTNR